MGSPYHAHFELRRQTLGLAWVLGLHALAGGGWAISGSGPTWLRILVGALAICIVVLAVGIHRAREWARIGGMVPGAAYVAFACYQPSAIASEPLWLLVGASAWLALPSTKVTFETAREMIRRTEEIKREQALKRGQYKRHLRQRKLDTLRGAGD